MIFSLGILLKGIGMDDYSGWNVDGSGDGYGAWGGDEASYKTWDGDGFGGGFGGGYGDSNGDGDGWSYPVKEFK